MRKSIFAIIILISMLFISSVQADKRINLEGGTLKVFKTTETLVKEVNNVPKDIPASIADNMTEEGGMESYVVVEKIKQFYRFDFPKMKSRKEVYGTRIRYLEKGLNGDGVWTEEESYSSSRKESDIIANIVNIYFPMAFFLIGAFICFGFKDDWNKRRLFFTYLSFLLFLLLLASPIDPSSFGWFILFLCICSIGGFTIHFLFAVFEIIVCATGIVSLLYIENFWDYFLFIIIAQAVCFFLSWSIYSFSRRHRFFLTTHKGHL